MRDTGTPPLKLVCCCSIVPAEARTTVGQERKANVVVVLQVGAGAGYGAYPGYPGYGAGDPTQAYGSYGADPYSAYAAFGGYDAALQVKLSPLRHGVSCLLSTRAVLVTPCEAVAGIRGCWISFTPIKSCHVGCATVQRHCPRCASQRHVSVPFCLRPPCADQR